MVIISSQEFMLSDTYPASICKSGSATVTITPIMKEINAINHTFRECVSTEPIFSPMTSIDISAPILNPASPTISSTAPTRKSINGYTSSPSSTASAAIIRAIGRMLDSDSASLSLKAVLIGAPYLPYFCIIVT